MNTNVMRAGSGYRDANVSAVSCSFQNKKNIWAVDGEAALSQIFTRVDSLQDNFTNQMGYKYFAGIRKISGTWQYGAGHEALSNTFDRNDMGYLGTNNFATSNAYLNYNRVKPWRSILSSSNGVQVYYSQNYTTGIRTNMSVNLNLQARLKSFWSVWCGGGITPVHSHEYFEPRIPGRFSYNPEGWWIWGGVGSDDRKRLSFFTNINTGAFNKKNFYNLQSPVMLGYNFAPRLRVNDKLSFSYFFGYIWDPNNLGFANLDTAGEIIYGERILHTYENSLSAKYIFKNDLSFSLNARHYWSTGEYIRYYTLRNDGMIGRNYVYNENNNFSYNAFTVDAVFSWQFAPGSQLSIVYKNVIEKDEQIIAQKFNDNLSQTLNSPQTNSISLKVLYYLDHQYLKRKK